MAEFPTYEREELDQRARDLIRSRRRGADVSEGSDFDIWARILGAVAWGIQRHGRTALSLLDPRKAFGSFLRQYALESGVGRDILGVNTAAVAARGKVIIRSTTGSQTQLAGSVLRHADGSAYTLDSSVTTSATAVKTLRSGHRSGRRRLYQGHAGAGFVFPVAGEVYLANATGEHVALKDVENSTTLQRYLFDLYNELDADPETHDTFSQEFGTVGSITGSVAGVGANKDPKDVLTITLPVGTIVAEAQILYLRDGADAMNASAMQDALRSLLGVRAGTGTVADIRAIAKSYPGIDLRECYVTPATYGVSTYTLLPISADGAYVGPSELNAIRDYVAARISPVDKVYVAAVYEERDTEIEFINVSCASAYAPDWTLSDQGDYGIAVATSGVSSLALAAVDDMAVGDRIIVTNISSLGPYVVQRRVTSMATLTIGLDEPLPHPPEAGASYVTPGGPLGSAIIEAIYAAYEARAPRVGVAGPQVRFPKSDVTDDPQGIIAAVSAVGGVVDCAYGPSAPPTLTAVGGTLVPVCVIRMYS